MRFAMLRVLVQSMLLVQSSSSSSSSSSTGSCDTSDCTNDITPPSVLATPPPTKTIAGAITEAQRLVSLDPSGAYILAVDAIKQLEGGDDSAWRGATTLLQATACRVAASAASLLTMNTEAASYYAKVVTLLELSPAGTVDAEGRPVEMELIGSSVDAAEQYSKAGGHHATAMQHLEHARLYRPRKRAADQLHFDRALTYAEAAVMRCSAGNDRLNQAAVLYKRGLDLTKEMLSANSNGGDAGAGASASGSGSGSGWTSADKHAAVIKLNSLVEVLQWSGQQADASAVSREAAQLAGWTNPVQRPTHYFDRSIVGPGWRDGDALEALGKGVGSIITLLEEAAPALRAEYASLRKRKLLRRQTECLHDPALGSWSHYPVLGDESADGACSDASAAITPAACNLLETIRKQNARAQLRENENENANKEEGAVSASADASLPPSVRIRRLGYSVLEPGGRIRPHTGPDNRLIKMHLGLRIPSPAGCSSFTIAGETRTWSNGKVIVFDDSWEHSVANECAVSRAVLQVVLWHPRA